MMMTKLISSDDPRYFTETSNISYDRHRYKIVSKHYCTMIVESWQEVIEYWWNRRQFASPVIEVIDKPKPKSKGFK